MKSRLSATLGLHFVLPIVLLAALAGHATKRAVEWTDLARHEASAGRHEAALAALDSALALDPADFEARLLKARVLSWSGRFDESHILLTRLANERPGHTDVSLVAAYLHYYQGRNAEATAAFRKILTASPANGDAQEGLALAEKALAATPQSPKSRLWRLDAGGDYSVFTRGTLPDWNQQFLQLSRRLPLWNEESAPLVTHVKVERYERYELIDWSLETGIYHEFNSRFRAAIAGGFTPDATFRPTWRLSSDLEALALDRGSSPQILQPSVWLLAGGRYDAYDQASFLSLQPGARFEWGGGSGVTGRISRVMEMGADGTTGWSLRADALTGSPRLGPIKENVRLWIGLADAPETQVVAGLTETVSTRTVFAGLGIDFAGDWSAMVGYARDDREASWIRHVVNVGIAHAF